MRFLENGPSIPGELLNARDEGRVVFFCGAGVSRARVGLPDFFGLAETVISELGAADNSEAAGVLKKAREVGEELRIPGLISADRIFSLLERTFDVADIQQAVARCVAPKTKSPDLSAHKILLRLARTPDSLIQLVTTNFDLLFNSCDGDRQVYLPPRLPYLSKYDDFNGVVYLHGCVNDSYSHAVAPGFILSSAEFGNAYLSEGWATQFFREIVRRYVVVFVGYSADDPPVYYLLEGLRRTKDPTRRIYAFQRGKRDEAVAQWEPKGVEAIAYGELNGHDDLWSTLEAWAERADNPDAWRGQVITKSLDGPQVLKAHERGQVAHIVSTYQGAKEFAESKPPAEWLCVFDSKQRFARPDKLHRFDPESKTVDPFELYGLDSDLVPEKGDPENPYIKRDVPPSAWDAFASKTTDEKEQALESFPLFRGPGASSVSRLPRRLASISNWMMDVADQPALLWWAVQQEAVHPSVRSGIA